MAIDAATAVELLRKLGAERDVYLQNLTKSTELLGQIIASAGGVSVPHPAPVPAAVPNRAPLPFPQPPFQPIMRLTADTLRRNSTLHTLPPLDIESVHRNGSLLSASVEDDDDSNSEDGEPNFASIPLAAESYDLDGLRKHIRTHPWNAAGRKILRDVLGNENILLGRESLFPTTEQESLMDRSQYSHASVFEVSEDGLPYVPVSSPKPGLTSRSFEIWDMLKGVNSKVDVENGMGPAMGKIVCIREPSPLLYAAVHYTMNKHFDMDEIFEYLVHHDPTFVRPPEPFSEHDRRRRTFLVNIEYFTIIGRF